MHSQEYFMCNPRICRMWKWTLELNRILLLACKPKHLQFYRPKISFIFALEMDQTSSIPYINSSVLWYNAKFNYSFIFLSGRFYGHTGLSFSRLSTRKFPCDWNESCIRFTCMLISRSRNGKTYQSYYIIIWRILFIIQHLACEQRCFIWLHSIHIPKSHPQSTFD